MLESVIPNSNFHLLALCLTWCTACGAPASETPPPSDSLTYGIEYTVSAQAGDVALTVILKLSQARSLLREVTMHNDGRLSEFEADGNLDVSDHTVLWQPPPSGGTLRWKVDVVHRRNANGFDAWIGPNWGLFRAEDAIPRASTRSLKGAKSDTRLRFDLPAGWSVVTQYFDDGGQFRIHNPERRFDQPSGWIVLGDLGVRRETISGIRVAIAGPVNHSVRRMDMLALLNWTLPELSRLLPDLPPRLTVISAGDPMWRGGLSAPSSVYLHAARPLISENATSTLLHEVMHFALDVSAADGYDWIVEGLAEYYSLAILNRSGTIPDSRIALATADLADWATTATTLCARASTGATTALAVGIFSALDREIRELSGDEADLDDVVRELAGSRATIDAQVLAEITESIAGSKPDTLHIDNLPGCRNIASGP